jgi:hypothetical protein
MTVIITSSEESTTDRYKEDISLQGGEEMGRQQGRLVGSDGVGEMGSGCLVLSPVGNERI